nr:transposase [Streptomyces humi]
MPLTDAQGARIEPLLPDRTPRRGGRRRDHREVIDAIAFEFRTGTQWAHLPEKYGYWRGVYNRLRMWALDGTWQRVFTTLEQWRGIATRYEKTATIYLAGLHIAGIFLWSAR